MILGGGSNVLFTEHFDGIILKNNLKGINRIQENEENVQLEVRSGENWHQFVSYCVENSYGGVENLALIPGTTGAAPIQNIGAYGVEVRNSIEKVKSYNIISSVYETFNNQQCKFGYRESIFKRSLKGKVFIYSVIFQLSKKHELVDGYADLKNFLKDNKITNPGIRDIFNAVVQIRTIKLPDPSTLGNAGSFFKNPVVSNIRYQRLLLDFPELPHYTVDDKHVKVPAAWLIDRLGWKGKRFGNVGVHERQALVLVNFGGGTGIEILDLAKNIIRSVKNEFDLELVPEVNII